MRPITGPSPRQALSVTIRRGGAATNYPILGRPARNTCTCQKFSKAAPCCQNCNCETITAHGRMGFWSGLQSSVDPGGLGHLIWVQWACKSRSDLPTTKMLLMRAGEWRAVKKNWQFLEQFSSRRRVNLAGRVIDTPDFGCGEKMRCRRRR